MKKNLFAALNDNSTKKMKNGWNGIGLRLEGSGLKARGRRLGLEGSGSKAGAQIGLLL